MYRSRHVSMEMALRLLALSCFVVVCVASGAMGKASDQRIEILVSPSVQRSVVHGSVTLVNRSTEMVVLPPVDRFIVLDVQRAACRSMQASQFRSATFVGPVDATKLGAGAELRIDVDLTRCDALRKVWVWRSPPPISADCADSIAAPVTEENWDLVTPGQFRLRVGLVVPSSMQTSDGLSWVGEIWSDWMPLEIRNESTGLCAGLPPSH